MELEEKRQYQFDGGMQNDIRSKSAKGARLIKNFDALTYPSTLKPVFSSVSGDATPTHEIANFLYAEGKLWGLGIASPAKPKIFYKDVFTTDSWSEPSNGEGTMARFTNFFTYYKSAIYGAQTGEIYKFLTSGGGFTDADLSITFTNISNGIVHSKDDILYVGYDNKIAKNNAGSWTAVALTLPTDYYITSICEYGNYIAIACAPLGTAGRTNSRMFLWDRDSSLATIAESIDWGAESLFVVDELNGELVGISYSDTRIVFKRYAGVQGAQQIMEFVGSSITLGRYKQIFNNRLYFTIAITIDGVAHYGICSFGKNLEGYYTFALEHTPNNNTDPNSSSSLQGFLNLSIINVYSGIFIAYHDAAGNPQVSKSSTTAYSHNSTFESLKIDDGDPSQMKKLVGVTVTYEPLPAAGSVTVKYKKDEETSWTTIFTDSTDNSISHSAINIEATGATLPEYKEIQIQIIATGGAAITGFSHKSEVTGKRSYN